MRTVNVLITIGLWAAFGFQHSFFAQHRFKEFLRHFLGAVFIDHFYRLCYFLSQCIIYPIFWFLVSNLDSGPILWTFPKAFYPVFFALQFLGSLLIVLAILSADAMTFVGLRPSLYYVTAKLRQIPPSRVSVFGTSKLVVSFPFNVIRHPMYLGIALAFVTSTAHVTEQVLLNFFCLCTYLYLGIYFEEKQLIRIFGPEYSHYRESTGALFPTQVLQWMTDR